MSRAVKRAKSGRQSTINKLRESRAATAKLLKEWRVLDGLLRLRTEERDELVHQVNAISIQRDDALADVKRTAQIGIDALEAARRAHGTDIHALREEIEAEKAITDAAVKTAEVRGEDARAAELAQAAAEQRVVDLQRVVAASERSVVEAEQRVADLQRALDESRAAVTRLVTLHHVADGVSVVEATS